MTGSAVVVFGAGGEQRGDLCHAGAQDGETLAHLPFQPVDPLSHLGSQLDERLTLFELGLPQGVQDLGQAGLEVLSAHQGSIVAQRSSASELMKMSIGGSAPLGDAV